MTLQSSKRKRKSDEGRKRNGPRRRKRESIRKQRRPSRLVKRWRVSATVRRDAIVVARGHLDDLDRQDECYTMNLTTGGDPGRGRRHGETDARLQIVQLRLEGKAIGGTTTIQRMGEAVSMQTDIEFQREAFDHTVVSTMFD